MAIAILWGLSGCTFDAAGLEGGAPVPEGADADAGELVPPPPPLPDAQVDDVEIDAGEDPSPPGPPEDDFGDSCANHEDCDSGLCHDFKGSKGKRCTIECVDDTDCPPDDDRRCSDDGVCVP